MTGAYRRLLHLYFLADNIFSDPNAECTTYTHAPVTQNIANIPAIWQARDDPPPERLCQPDSLKSCEWYFCDSGRRRRTGTGTRRVWSMFPGTQGTAFNLRVSTETPRSRVFIPSFTDKLGLEAHYFFFFRARVEDPSVCDVEIAGISLTACSSTIRPPACLARPGLMLSQIEQFHDARSSHVISTTQVVVSGVHLGCLQTSNADSSARILFR